MKRIIVLVLLIISPYLFAHSGGRDANSGHISGTSPDDTAVKLVVESQRFFDVGMINSNTVTL